MLLHGLRVERYRVIEKETAEHRELIEPLRTHLQEFEYGREPCTAIPEVLVAPQSGFEKERTEAARELVWRQPHHVLLIEPVQLLGIEHGVSATDPRQIEHILELVCG